MATKHAFGEKPTSPPPDPNKPYIWIGGQWLLIAMDTTDGVPSELNFKTFDDGYPGDDGSDEE